MRISAYQMVDILTYALYNDEKVFQCFLDRVYNDVILYIEQQQFINYVSDDIMTCKYEISRTIPSCNKFLLQCFDGMKTGKIPQKYIDHYYNKQQYALDMITCITIYFYSSHCEVSANINNKK